MKNKEKIRIILKGVEGDTKTPSQSLTIDQAFSAIVKLIKDNVCECYFFHDRQCQCCNDE